METKPKHFFYVLECNDGSYYAGYTIDLIRRVNAHNKGKGAKYTRAKRPVHCIYFEEFETKREALQAEYRFKQLNRKKKELYVAERGGHVEITKKL